MGVTENKQPLPIGIDSFRMVRNNGYYYIDKTLMIKDFIENKDGVALITRPRRFGKTINMSMMSDFFDIMQDSRDIFEGLKIMDTEYADKINTRPVIYISLKGCTGKDEQSLLLAFQDTLISEYIRYDAYFGESIDHENAYYYDFYRVFKGLKDRTMTFPLLRSSLNYLVMAAYTYFKKEVIILIDEYDQPMLSSYEYGYRDELKDFFAEFFGCVLKGNTMVSQALLTGIQRVAKESIFSRLNNIQVYSVVNTGYCKYFGLTAEETKTALAGYGYELNDDVKNMYDGYRFGDTEIYNPWSILNYMKNGRLEPYWINTSTNMLIRAAMQQTNLFSGAEFEQLLTNESVNVTARLEASFMELSTEDTLWGLLINSGYLTVLEEIQDPFLKQLKVTIPNGEVRGEFQSIISELGDMNENRLNELLKALISVNMLKFEKIYKDMVLNMTSSFDAAHENAYHMLMLGMCAGLSRYYRISSNMENGYGRSDIRLESKVKIYPHIVIEFKQSRDKSIESMKKEAIDQIIEKEYCTGLKGKVLCVGIVHKGKECGVEYREMEV